MSDATTAPELPYAVEMMPQGVRDMPTKVFKDPRKLHTETLTDDEREVWAYVQWLEDENARLRADLEALTATAPETPKKGKK